MSYIFCECKSLELLPNIFNCKISNILNMKCMFTNF